MVQELFRTEHVRICELLQGRCVAGWLAEGGTSLVWLRYKYFFVFFVLHTINYHDFIAIASHPIPKYIEHCFPSLFYFAITE